MLKKLGLVALIEASFFAALAYVFDLLPSIRLSPSISISFAMVPIFLLAFRRGFLVSALAGFIWGLLQVALGDAARSFLTPLQGFIEYFVAFAFIGFAGFFYQPVQTAFRKGRKKAALCLVTVAVFVGTIARYFWHFIAGFIFWGEFAPEGMNPVWFSFVANGVTSLGAAVLCSLLTVLIVSSAPTLIRHKTTAPVFPPKKAS
ncbi:energy-coupled thiamine transporter ThiT [Sediminibacillus halophilus]|uniref:Thiamine transporter n=1 Tax=Sediminibacillus halophilus TaxID=482461 RepID=A0A1G9NDC6_9BACI|nr:thiamine transporter [Sediminibacillus halophilus]